MGAVAAIVGLVLIPPLQTQLGPATVAVRTLPGSGETRLRLPPLGTIVARSHPVPLRFEVSLVEVHVEELAPLTATAGGRERLRAMVERDLAGLVLKAAIRALIGAGLIAAIAVAAVFHPRWPYFAFSAASGIVTVALLLTLAGLTYRSEAFEQPRFTGPLTRARQVISVVTRGTEALEEARSRFETATQRISDLLVLLAQPDRDPFVQETVLLHVSDIHANPIGLEIAQELAREFQVDAVIDTGDLASSTLDTGELSSLTDTVDAALVNEIEEINARYLFVPGNHDSFSLRNLLRRARNVEFLDGETASVGEVSILGWGDPTFSTRPIPEEAKEQERLELAPEVLSAVQASGPDILAVHDERLAAGSYGSVPLVLAGHTHKRAVEEAETTLVLTVGSTGATGLKSLTVETEREYEAEVLYFDGDDLVAVDYISLTGVGGDFELQRTTYSLEEG